MDAFSASLMADKREIIFAPTVYKFQTFAQMAEEFKLGGHWQAYYEVHWS